jgi:hypothetical protein
LHTFIHDDEFPTVFQKLLHSLISMKTKRSWKSYLGAGALAVALLVILNPEIRALLLLADAVGLEALFLMVIAQLRNYWPALRAAVQPIAAVMCRLSSRIGISSMGAFQIAMPIRPLPYLLGPVFIALSYGVQCSIKNSET